MADWPKFRIAAKGLLSAAACLLSLKNGETVDAAFLAVPAFTKGLTGVLGLAKGSPIQSLPQL